MSRVSGETVALTEDERVLLQKYRAFSESGGQQATTRNGVFVSYPEWNRREAERADLLAQLERLKADSGLLDELEANDCLSGDCPHWTQRACDKALADHLREVLPRRLFPIQRVPEMTETRTTSELPATPNLVIGELEALLNVFAEASRERLANAPEGCDCSACGDYRAARQSVIRWVAERTISADQAGRLESYLEHSGWDDGSGTVETIRRLSGNS